MRAVFFFGYGDRPGIWGASDDSDEDSPAVNEGTLESLFTIAPWLDLNQSRSRAISSSESSALRARLGKGLETTVGETPSSADCGVFVTGEEKYGASIWLDDATPGGLRAGNCPT